MATGGQVPTMVNMIETEYEGMMGSELEDMEYEDDREYADILAWDGPDPKPAHKRKRAVLDGEAVECRLQHQRPTLRPVGSGRPGRAIPEEDLDDQPHVITAADLYEKPKRKRRTQKDQEPIQMMKGQQKFNTMETLRNAGERPPRKKTEKAKEVSLAERGLSLSRSRKVGYDLPEPIGRIVNFYTTA